jgi:hypothetical protein
MKTVTDLETLKVHAGRDGIWYLDGAGLPRLARMSVAEFIGSALLKRVDKVRVIGAPCNVALVVALFNQKVRKRIASVEVATPLVCHTQSERDDPATVLYHMRRFSRAPSQGGFHEVTEYDYRAYALAYEVQQHRSVTKLAIRLLHAHPAWKPLTFIQTISPSHCAQLLAEIIDPRWFVDVCRPDRAAKLQQYLGLMPKTQASVTLGKPAVARGRERCALVLNCWKQRTDAAQIASIFELTGPKAMPNASAIGIRPGDFVWRTWGYLMGKGPDSRKPPKSPTIADLRASIRFVDFLRQVWVQELYRGAQLPDGGLLFDADYFFKQDVVAAEAYHHYMQSGR